MPKQKISFQYPDKRQEKIIEEWKKFYTILDPAELQNIQFELFDPEKRYQDRKRVYKKYKKKFDQLKPIFKRIIKEQNKFAQSIGQPSWVEWNLRIKGIYPMQIDFFLDNVDSVIEKLYKNLPVEHVPDWWWTRYAMPHCHSHVETPKYQMPNEIIEIIKRMNPTCIQYLDKITIEHDANIIFPFCEFREETKTCLIKTNLKSTCFYERLTLVHEFAHAFDFLADSQERKKVIDRSYYRREGFAHSFVQQFVDYTLEGQVNDAVNARILENLVLAIFEYEIYKNPDKDFDILYAQAHNRVFAKCHQTKNQMYLMRDTVLMRPGGMIATGIIDVELVMGKI